MSSRMAKITAMILMVLAVGAYFFDFFTLEMDGLSYAASGVALAFGFDLGPACSLGAGFWRLIYMLIPLAIFVIWCLPMPRRRQFRWMLGLSLADAVFLIILRSRFVGNVGKYDPAPVFNIGEGFLFALAFMFMALLLCFFGTTALSNEERGYIPKVSLRREPWLAADPNQSPDEWTPIYIRDPKNPKVPLGVVHPWDLKQQEKEAARKARRAARQAAPEPEAPAEQPSGEQ